MKPKLIVLSFVLLLLVFTGCGKKGVDVEPGPTNLISTTELVENDEGYIWVVYFYQMNCDTRVNRPGAIMDIRNELDRNITLDFDGPSHYVVSIGDKKTYRLELQPGTYKVMASAPGLKFVPREYGIAVEDFCMYQQLWKRTIRQTTYRR
jgi:hypothetical protein